MEFKSWLARTRLEERKEDNGSGSEPRWMGFDVEKWKLVEKGYGEGNRQARGRVIHPKAEQIYAPPRSSRHIHLLYDDIMM